MKSLGFAVVLILFLVMSDFAFCADNPPLHPSKEGTNVPQMQFSKNRDIAQVKPRKPVKIKLHRGGKGEYQWDITGDSADDIVRADKRLRKLLEIE